MIHETSRDQATLSIKDPFSTEMILFYVQIVHQELKSQGLLNFRLIGKSCINKLPR